jgi:cell division protein FtsB
MATRIRDEKTTGGRSGLPVVPARRHRLATFILLFFALALVIDAVAGERGWIANSRGSRQLEQVEQDLAAKRRENAELRDRRDRLARKDPATIEDVARRELMFIRKGEKVLIVKDAPKAKQ